MVSFKRAGIASLLNIYVNLTPEFGSSKQYIKNKKKTQKKTEELFSWLGILELVYIPVLFFKAKKIHISTEIKIFS